MKIALAQIEVVPANPSKNFEKIKEWVTKAKAEKADMIVFPELCIPGYLISDMWEEQSFLRDILQYNEDVRELSDGIHILFGSIGVDFNKKHTDGRPIIHNALYYAKDNKFIKFNCRDYYVKALLPNYREFEESRHFTSPLGTEIVAGESADHFFNPITITGTKIGVCLCEDGWDKDYSISPIKIYKKRGAKLIINCSCSPYTIGKNNSRNRVFGEGHAKSLGLPIIYLNAVGIQNSGKNIYTFDGSSVAYNKRGEIVAQAPMFKEHMMYIDWDNVFENLFNGEKNELPKSDIAEVAEALKYGIKKYLEACGTNRVVIGASGGIDSCVAASLYAQVVGPENLLLVNMPSKYNSKTTINIAERLAQKIECYYVSIPIEESVELTKQQINGLEVCRFKKMEEGWGFPGQDLYLPVFTNGDPLWEKRILNLSPVHMENVQARDRSSRILAALSSAWGGVFTCNGNKDELTVGYCTMLGDLAGFMAVLGDLRKPMVYELGEYLNNTYPVLPPEVFTVVASAELSAEQNVDEGKGDPLVYWYHSKLFYTWVESWFRKTPEDNLRWYIAGTIDKELEIPEGKSVYTLFPTAKEFIDDLEHWYKLFNGMAVAKRVQAPPVITVTRRSFGFDYRESLNCFYLTREYYKLKEKSLSK